MIFLIKKNDNNMKILNFDNKLVNVGDTIIDISNYSKDNPFYR